MRNNKSIMPMLILLAIIILIDLYAYQGVKTITKNLRPRTKRITRIAYWLISVSIVLSLALSIISVFRAGNITTFAQWSLNIFLTLFVTKLVFIIVLFFEDIYRGVAAVIHFLIPRSKRTTTPAPMFPERRKLITGIAILAAGIPFSAFVYGITKGKYNYKLHRQALYFKDLPEAFEGFTITQVSDIHSGSFDNKGAVQRGIDIAKAQHSDLFVFTGDLVNNRAEEILPWLAAFSQLKAPYGQYSILGNHDYGEYVNWNSEEEKAANLERLKKHHVTLGYRLLLDEHVSIQKDGQKITLIGVQNWGTGFIQKGDLKKALSGVDDKDFKLLLSHDPSHWEAQVKNNPTLIHLTLAGHTHGMQMGIETPDFKWSPIQYRYPHWAGVAEQNGRTLYVNRGFGFIGFSGRVGIWPEVTVIELRRSS